ncbi:MAG TPA: DUF1554 domain-containing protein [Leptospiraceae bacterium]|nr:DUF1554 domain-containing protein [Leptospiraceae bacterium]
MGIGIIACTSFERFDMFSVMRKLQIVLVLIVSSSCTGSFPRTSLDSESQLLLARALFQSSSATSAAAVPSCASNAFCYTFRTNGLASANLGGISGADATCNSDVNKPAGATGSFKAFLVDPQTNLRRASVTANLGDGQIDWVLRPSKQYRRSDGITILGTTGSNSLFTFALTNSFVSSAGGHWTGLASTWVYDACHCTGWTSTAGSGRDGADNSTSTTAIFNNATLCNTSGPTIICIEQ